jgi:hypothetical protein
LTGARKTPPRALKRWAFARCRAILVLSHWGA